jgi:uncharacterized protein (UPF0303 family)
VTSSCFTRHFRAQLQTTTTGRKYAEANTDLNTATGLPLALYSDHGGCFPILVRDVGPVGTVTVSGLAQHNDHALVVEALELALTR